MTKSFNKSNRVAVFGAKGYIGMHLVQYLTNLGYNVDKYDYHDIREENYTRIDITDIESLKRVRLDVDFIFMFAGLTGTYAGFDHFKTYNSVNELGLLNLLDLIRKSIYRPRVVFPSTRLVYKGDDKPLKETDEKETKTLYAVNKLSCEGILQAYNCSFEIPYTIFRICIPYGNLLSRDYSFGTVGFFIKKAKVGEDICLYGGGNMKRTFTHIEDLCFQIVSASLKEESACETYNVGGETLSLREAAEIISRKFGTYIKDVPWPEQDLKIESGHTYFDDTKIKKLLNIKSYKRLCDFTNDI
jgi:UDP-glucose 4-epimerase